MDTLYSTASVVPTSARAMVDSNQFSLATRPRGLRDERP